MQLKCENISAGFRPSEASRRGVGVIPSHTELKGWHILLLKHLPTKHLPTAVRRSAARSADPATENQSKKVQVSDSRAVVRKAGNSSFLVHIRLARLALPLPRLRESPLDPLSRGVGRVVFHVPGPDNDDGPLFHQRNGFCKHVARSFLPFSPTRFPLTRTDRPCSLSPRVGPQRLTQIQGRNSPDSSVCIIEL